MPRRADAAAVKWTRLIVGFAVAGALMSCGTAPRLATPTAPPVKLAAAPPATAAQAPKTAVELSVQVQPEPNDYAHRNYCAEGAIAGLLSTWTSAVPSIDAIGVSAHVSETRGTKGPDAVQAINGYLEQITGTARYAYSKSYVTSPAILKSQLETDLSGLGRFAHSDHGSAVLVHVWTDTLPGWNGYQASHVIAVFGYDFTPGSSSGDTVTYAESAGTVAGYNGPQVQTISLAALWTATETPPTLTHISTTPMPLHDPWTLIG